MITIQTSDVFPHVRDFGKYGEGACSGLLLSDTHLMKPKQPCIFRNTISSNREGSALCRCHFPVCWQTASFRIRRVSSTTRCVGHGKKQYGQLFLRHNAKDVIIIRWVPLGKDSRRSPLRRRTTRGSHCIPEAAWCLHAFHMLGWSSISRPVSLRSSFCVCLS